MLIKRLYWDIRDNNERQYYWYWFIWQVPGLFGSMLRAKYLAKRFKSTGVNLNVYAGARFRSMEKIEVGDNVVIGYDNFIQGYGGVTIGKNVSLGPGVKVWSVNHNVKEKDLSVNDQGITEGVVMIGEDVFVGANSVLLPGVNLPKGVIVTAGSIVNVKAYKPFSILAGNPARVIGYRE